MTTACQQITICQQINLLLKFAFDSGNSIKEISENWSNAKKVIHMFKKLEPGLKKKIELELIKLDYWMNEGAPHFPSDEGYFCNQCKIGVSFPI